MSLAPTKAEVRLRPWLPEDQPEIETLWATTRQRPFHKEQIERILRIEGGALVAEATTPEGETRLAGILIWTHNADIAMLWRVAVAPEFREQGVATALVNQAEQDALAAGLEGITLLTREVNAPAKALYAKLGYRHQEALEFWGKRLPSDLPSAQKPNPFFEDAK